MLKEALLTISPLLKQDIDDIIYYFKVLEYPKNYILLKQGRVCEHIYFLEKGFCRYFHTTKEGKESNVWFSFENDILTSLSSFLRQKPSFQSIQLLEDCELYGMSYQDFQHLKHKFSAFEQMYHILLEEEIFMMEERIYELQFLSAKERYTKLLQKYPALPQRISLGHIASYLNITQETLSRIRANKL